MPLRTPRPRDSSAVDFRSSRFGRTAAYALAAISLLSAANAAGAQSAIRGSVRDIASQEPIRRATVNLLNDRDSILTSALTSDSGAFFLRVDRAGTYAIQVRRVGWTPILTERFQLAAGDTMAFEVELGRPPVTLDTVVVRDEQSTLLGVTPGREFVRRHYALGTGMIISGLEIRSTGLKLTDYLGKQAGIKLTTGALATIPGMPAFDQQMIYSTTSTGCLYARIDRNSALFMMMNEAAGWLDDAIDLAKVMAVEVYLSPSEVPKEWGFEAHEATIYARNFARPQLPDDLSSRDYLIGHTGMRRLPSSMVEDDAFSFGTKAWPFPPPGGRGSLAGRSAARGGCGFLQIWTSAAW